MEMKRPKCRVCLKQLSSYSSLSEHSRYHTGIGLLHCPYCQRPFNNKSNYKNHLRIHTKEMPFKCSACKAAFKRRDLLKLHMNSSKCMLEALKNSKLAAKGKEDTKPAKVIVVHKCDMCYKIFLNEEVLNEHILYDHYLQNKIELPEDNAIELNEKAQSWSNFDWSTLLKFE